MKRDRPGALVQSASEQWPGPHRATLPSAGGSEEFPLELGMLPALLSRCGRRWAGLCCCSRIADSNRDAVLLYVGLHYTHCIVLL